MRFWWLPSGVNSCGDARSYFWLLCVCASVCLCQQEHRWVCGCVHRSAQSFCTVHCMRVVKCIQFTRLPVLLAWEHKCFFICVCVHICMQLCLWATFQQSLLVRVTESFWAWWVFHYQLYKGHVYDDGWPQSSFWVTVTRNQTELQGENSQSWMKLNCWVKFMCVCLETQGAVAAFVRQCM